MIAKAQTRYIRISPRKFRQIIPLVTGKRPEDAIAILMSMKKKASIYAIELLKSAMANAGRMQGVQVSDLYISRLVANCGPQLKRYRAGSMGRASPIRKRTAHIVVELDLIAPKHAGEVKAAPVDAKIKKETPKKEAEPIKKAANKKAAAGKSK